MNGKGSNPRPLSVSREEFARRWDEAFGGTPMGKRPVQWIGIDEAKRLYPTRLRRK